MAEKQRLSDKDLKIIDHLLKLYGTYSTDRFKEIFHVDPEQLGYVTDKDTVFLDRYLLDNKTYLGFLRLGIEPYQYTYTEIMQGRGYRREEIQVRAAVRKWLSEHGVAKPDTAMRRLRELQEMLLQAKLMSSIKSILGTRQADLSVSFWEEALDIVDADTAGLIVGQDADTLLPLLKEWNGNIRLYELYGHTLNEVISSKEIAREARERFEHPEDPTEALLNRYLRAMGFFYNIISIKKAYEIISQQNPGLISPEAFYEYCDRFDDPSELTVVDQGEILTQYVAWNPDSYQKLKEAQRGKPWYIPSKEELLKYYEERYTENTPQRKAFKAYLMNTMHCSDEKAEDCIAVARFCSKSSASDLSFIMEQLRREGLVFRGLDQMNELLRYLTDFTNNMRQPENRGFTPCELMKQNPGPAQIRFGPGIMKSIENGETDGAELIQKIEQLGLKVAPETKKEVGRNDPCPCGSGKKYKKCCGRLS